MTPRPNDDACVDGVWLRATGHTSGTPTCGPSLRNKGRTPRYRRPNQEADAGDYFRLAFDQPDTWSQKYNLVWDRVLGLHLFPAAVAQKEMAFYRRMQGCYGLALDNRRLYTKLDWITWTATLTGSRGDFEALVAPVFDFLNATPHRVPMSDWYWTHDATKTGFQERSVVGGVFLRLLYDDGVWKKWDHLR